MDNFEFQIKLAYDRVSPTNVESVEIQVFNKNPKNTTLASAWPAHIALRASDIARYLLGLRSNEILQFRSVNNARIYRVLNRVKDEWTTVCRDNDD